MGEDKYEFYISRMFPDLYGNLPNILPIVTAISALVNGYNDFVKKHNNSKKGHLYPEITFGYNLIENAIRLYLRCDFDAQYKSYFDADIEYQALLASLEVKENLLYLNYKRKEQELKEVEERLKKEQKKIDEQWKALQSIEYKPEEYSNMTEEELADAIEKELRIQNADYLDLIDPK